MKKVLVVLVVIAALVVTGNQVAKAFKTMDENNPNAVEQLKAQVEGLSGQVSDLQGQVQRFTELNSREPAVTGNVENMSDDFLYTKVFNLIWKKTLHYLTFFESLDGFAQTTSGAGGESIVLDNTSVLLTTGATNANFAKLTKDPSVQGLITFSQRSFLRTSILLGANTNQTAYIAVGNVEGSSGYYGFKIVNGNLYGVSGDGSVENAVLLQAVSSNTVYNLEARYSPVDRVVFWVDGSEKGVSTSNFPKYLNTAAASYTPLPNTSLAYIKITANAAASKTLKMSFFEYFQARNILK